MPLEVSTTPNIRKLTERMKARFDATLAIEVTKTIKAPDSEWPVLTSFSRDRFIAEDDASGNILVLNSADYAAALEYGRNSRHRGALFRTIEKKLKKMTQKSLREAVARG